MSLVTNVILVFDCGQDEDARMKEVNDFFSGAGLVHSDWVLNGTGWYGGSKRFEANVAAGAFNYLNLDDFLEHLRRNVRWDTSALGYVQVFVCEHENDEWRLIDIYKWR